MTRVILSLYSQRVKSGQTVNSSQMFKSGQRLVKR